MRGPIGNPELSAHQTHPQGASPGVLVVGMARSGTSASTALLARLGLALTVDSDVIPGNVLNPRGVYESRTVRRFDQVLLARWCEGGWANPCLPAGWDRQPGVRMLHSAGRRLFESVHPTRPWLCKDPQFCLTLPFWLQALHPNPAVALTYRHPVAVARSLQRGMGYELSRGLAIWERHQRSALQALDGQSVAVVNYDELVAEPAGGAATLAGWLTALGVVLAADAQREAAAVIGEGQRHWHASGEDRRLLSPEQRDLVDLLDAGRGVHMRWSAPALGRETPTTTARFAATPIKSLLRRPRWWWWIAEQTMPETLSGPASRLRAPRRLRQVGSIEVSD